MRDNEDGKTVAAMDLLVPGVGEMLFFVRRALSYACRLFCDINKTYFVRKALINSCARCLFAELRVVSVFLFGEL